MPKSSTSASAHTHFPIRCGPLARVVYLVPIHSHVRLHGVPGFALHHSHNKPSQWVVSHIETGAECGTGPTEQSAMRDAIFRSRDASNVYAGIERTKLQLEILGVSL